MAVVVKAWQWEERSEDNPAEQPVEYPEGFQAHLDIELAFLAE